MAVIMISEVPGADRGLVEGLRASGLLDQLTRMPGFVSHLSGPTDTGFRVVEVWDTKESHQDWYDHHVAPNLPPGMAATPPEYIELMLTLPEHRDHEQGGHRAAASA
ncbi:antibiotic biosynthesis monooxygenase family protein [Intrasporangium flavum]|uniref:antibiotic biosynthesis monooxygenase family protein n=1 Tax=Intrasporangium flavum TaxID=1428657 RepID=UPI00096C9CDB|nr:hypothetical protein [Intrasporangium flavum]